MKYVTLLYPQITYNGQKVISIYLSTAKIHNLNSYFLKNAHAYAK